MKNLYVSLFLLPLILMACGGESPEPADEITDLRDQYTVSTLTETFKGSGGISVDDKGLIYVANFGDLLGNANGIEVTRVDPLTGELSEFAKGLVGPSGNAFDNNGNLIQANIKGDFISHITPDGTVTTLVDEGVSSPVGVAVDKGDNIYVCNCAGNSISKITPDGSISTFVESTLLSCPNGLAIDDDGNLYPVNFNNNQIRKITPDGTISEFASINGSSCAHIAFKNGRLYVVGRGANQIFEVSLEGKVSLIAGDGLRGDLDGGGEIARFHIPNGIGLSPDGSKIYVSDRLAGLPGSGLNPVVVRVIEKK